MTDTTANAVHFETAHGHDAHSHADHKPGFFARWFMSTNHKIGAYRRDRRLPV